MTTSKVWIVFLTPYADSTVSASAEAVFGKERVELEGTYKLDEAITLMTSKLKELGVEYVSSWHLIGGNIPHSIQNTL